MPINRNEVRQIVLETIETMLELQLRAVHQIQGSEELPAPVRIKRGLRKNSLVDLRLKLIQYEGCSLHVNEIIVLILKRFGRVADKDAIAGALSKNENA